MMTSTRPSPAALIALLVVTLLAARMPASAQDQPAGWFDAISINGFVSSTWSYNANTPDSRRNTLHVFDVDDNSITVNVAELAFHRDAVKRNDVGFTVHLAAGTSVPRVSRSAGMNSGDVDVHQAYASWMAPLGSGLRVDVGKFVTHAGYEVIEGYDGFNDNATRSLLFGYALPFTHTGLRLTYAASSALSTALYVVNGWDNAVDNNSSKTLGAQIALAPMDGLSLILNGLYGPERDNNNSDNRSLIDVCASYNPGGTVTVGANMDIGSEARAAANDGDASWFGVAGYLRLKLADRFSLALRGEMFDDADGVRTGTVQKLTSVTLTPEYRPADMVVLRADLRLDSSDQSVFEKASSTEKSQFTLTLNMLFVL